MKLCPFGVGPIGLEPMTTACKADALPAELRPQIVSVLNGTFDIIVNNIWFVKQYFFFFLIFDKLVVFCVFSRRHAYDFGEAADEVGIVRKSCLHADFRDGQVGGKQEFCMGNPAF